jgi:hypothetical protein
MWKYDQATGTLTNPAGLKIGAGYSGNGPAMNNPADQSVPMHGPIPVGRWSIGSFFTDPEKGPVVAHLTAAEGTETYGRSGFMIHGDNPARNHTGSEGCVILARPFREAIAASKDHNLTVT